MGTLPGLQAIPQNRRPIKCKCGAEVTGLNVESFAGLGVAYVLKYPIGLGVGESRNAPQVPRSDGLLSCRLR
jgi:hypothetical protein